MKCIFGSYKKDKGKELKEADESKFISVYNIDYPQMQIIIAENVEHDFIIRSYDSTTGMGKPQNEVIGTSIQPVLENLRNIRDQRVFFLCLSENRCIMFEDVMLRNDKEIKIGRAHV